MKQNAHFIYQYFTLCLFLFLIISCSSPNLSRKISKDLRADNHIDAEEWSQICSLIKENPDLYPDLISNELINEDKLVAYINEISASSTRQRNKPKTVIDIYTSDSDSNTTNSNVSNNLKTKAIVPDNLKINVYIENSGSMDGYVKDVTTFEGALSKLLVLLNYKYGNNISVNFINDKIRPVKIENPSAFIQSLEPNIKPYYSNQDHTASSELNDCIKLILDHTDESTLSIFISDCIYSLEKGKNIVNSLEFSKNLTEGAILDKSKELNFSTVILKLNSNFTGKYYNNQNKGTWINNISRPYYIWFVGPPSCIKDLHKNLDYNTLSGYQNSVTFENTSTSKQPFFTILQSTNKIGRFKSTDRTNYICHSISDSQIRHKQFQFSIAIDLSMIPLDQQALLNPNNYTVPEGFSIRIEDLSSTNIDKRDQNQLKYCLPEKPTHIITFLTNRNSALHDIKLTIPSTTPAWIDETNSYDDLDISTLSNKTFGIKYLINGVSEAYDILNPEHNYLNINLHIKH